MSIYLEITEFFPGVLVVSEMCSAVHAGGGSAWHKKEEKGAAALTVSLSDNSSKQFTGEDRQRAGIHSDLNLPSFPSLHQLLPLLFLDNFKAHLLLQSSKSPTTHRFFLLYV